MVTMTGHSKGGAEAISMALRLNTNCITFNPGPINLGDYGSLMAAYNKTMTHWVVRGEAANSVFGEVGFGTTRYLDNQHPTPLLVKIFSPLITGINMVQNHFMGSVLKAMGIDRTFRSSKSNGNR